MIRLTRTIPSALTFLGGALFVAWLLGAPLWVGVAGLLCDALDGYAARRLGATSDFGSLYDWTTDVCCFALLAGKLGAPWLAVLAIPAQVFLRLRGRHLSGRAALFIVAALYSLAWGR